MRLGSHQLSCLEKVNEIEKLDRQFLSTEFARQAEAREEL